MSTLRAWRPYELSKRCFYKLHKHHSPGDMEDWDIYWLSGLAATRSIWDALRRELSRGSDIQREIWKSYKEGPATYMIHQSFVRDQRNQTLHEWIWDVVENPVCRSPQGFTEFVPTHKDLVFKYLSDHDGVDTVSAELQGEGPIRLLGIALQFNHENLTLIEEGIKQGVENPFQSPHRTKLLSESKFFTEHPDFYR